MGDAPVVLAVAAGMLAALNPCGFALLPVYLSALVVDRSDEPGRRHCFEHWPVPPRFASGSWRYSPCLVSP